MKEKGRIRREPEREVRKIGSVPREHVPQSPWSLSVANGGKIRDGRSRAVLETCWMSVSLR